MKNAFTKLVLVAVLAAGMVGAVQPTIAALTVHQKGRETVVSCVIQFDPDTSLLGGRDIWSTNFGVFEQHFATNLAWSSLQAAASAGHASDLRTNEHSMHLTFDGRSESSHSAAALSNGVIRVGAESYFSGDVIFSSDSAFSYTLIPFRSVSVTNEAEASCRLDGLGDADGVFFGLLVRDTPFGQVMQTNGSLALSGVAPAGDYRLSLSLSTYLSVEELGTANAASAASASLSGFEFRATSLPTPNTAPRLEVRPVRNSLILSWPMAHHAFDLEESSSVTGGLWSPVAANRTLVGERLVVTVETTSASRFFRLKRQ